ncbi:glutaredoxin [Kwoniella shandongensis]|uniref:Glutaredoxin n=1 Tax=Kwoniella shandongensis TaxID=1734106 RepID=A0A5M6BZ78_9TREE|nr:uncharacterized protein CI109_003434 [Kwoniella shandongensis]KAA5528146.1 hypothetical protein CI109_003434 [Kwoniella shandongensis]
MYGSVSIPSTPYTSSTSFSSTSTLSSEKSSFPLSTSTHGPPPKIDSPRRAFSLPTMKIKMPFGSSSSSSSSSTAPKYGLGLGIGGSPMLPSHHNSPGRSTARRLSYGIKNRASHYSYPLTVGGLFTLALFVFIHVRNSALSASEVGRFHQAASNKIQFYGRSEFSDEEHQHRIHLPDGERDNGVSLLTMDEDELIAEDDLFWDSYTDPEPLSEEEQAAEAEMKAHKQDVIEHDRKQSLRALIWWLAEGGIIPSKWEVPTKAYLRKVGGRGMERMLEDIDRGEEDDQIFENGWAEFANKRYQIVVFSKTHCPYSKKAKKILGEYHLSPAPFIIELDQRSDMEHLQNLLQRLTGRRTVPNILLDFTSIGGADDITLLHAEGGLQRRFQDMGAIPGSRRRRPAGLRLPIEDVKPKAEPVKVVEPVVPVAEDSIHDDFKRDIFAARAPAPAPVAPIVEEQIPIPILAETPLPTNPIESTSELESEQPPPAKRQKVVRDDATIKAFKRGKGETNSDRLHARGDERRRAAPGIGGSWDSPPPQVKRGSRGKVLV